ncbi:hypothetical protein OG394_25945 [Kribbella sp. NBC_01245]|uniref:hypothetical protein n=1 Tax=Kribbella sp. NBC_01245 TaxID=2903578 RepID=UPI002E27ACAD|nr:hypothetical protein [Kribbella sp. NBC_01245]
MKLTIRRALVTTIALAIAASTGATAANATTDTNTTTTQATQQASYLTATPTGKLLLNQYGRLLVDGTLKVRSTTGVLAPLKGQRVYVQARLSGSTTYKNVYATDTHTNGSYETEALLGKGYVGADIRVAYLSPYQSIASDFTYVGKIVGFKKIASVITTSLPSVLRPDAEGNFRFHGYLKVKHPSGKLVPLTNTIVMVRGMGGTMTQYERIAFTTSTSKSGFFMTYKLAGLDRLHGHKIQFLFKSRYDTIASSALYVGKIA